MKHRQFHLIHALIPLFLALTACNGAPPVETSHIDPGSTSQGLSQIKRLRIQNLHNVEATKPDPTTGVPIYYAVNGVLMRETQAQKQISNGFLGCFFKVENLTLSNGQVLEDPMINTGVDTSGVSPLHWMEITKYGADQTSSLTLTCIKNKSSVKQYEVTSALRGFVVLTF